jgi:hypothetical protein
MDEMKKIMYEMFYKRRDDKKVLNNINNLRNIVEELILYFNDITKGVFYHGGFELTNDSEEDFIIYFGLKYFPDEKISVSNELVTVKRKYFDDFEFKIDPNDVVKFKIHLKNTFTKIINSRNIKCKSCYELISLNTKELEYFHKKGLNPPKRCKSCRDKRKQNKLTNQEELNE